METINLVKKEAISKTDIKTTAANLAAMLDKDPTAAPLLMQKFKVIEMLKEAVADKLREASVAELKKYPEKDIMLYGAEFKVGEFGVKYDFTACMDPKWTELDRRIKELQEDKKARETYLKTLKGKTTWIDPDTGELCELMPPIKTSVTSVSCSIK